MIQLQECSRPQLARSHHDFNIPLPYCQTEKYWLLVASTVLVRQGRPLRPPNCTIPVLEALKQVAVWQPHALGTRRHFCQMEQYSLPEVLQMLRIRQPVRVRKFITRLPVPSRRPDKCYQPEQST